MSQSRQRTRTPLTLVVAAIGIVFGDIGTSPLYTLKTCFDLAGLKHPMLGDVLGICSLLFWALVLVVSIKYVTFIMRVNHDGEGGILALLALASPAPEFGKMIRSAGLTLVVVIGASMLLGDGMITPAISVISAVEGIGVVSSAFQPFIVPLSLLVIVGLFTVQRRGTARVGSLFGPVMVVWFAAIAVLGAVAVAGRPEIVERSHDDAEALEIAKALDPRYAAGFLVHGGLGGFVILGGVVLAVTGVEALYADMSHFGRGPIVMGWYALVFPALTLNYFGQGALLPGGRVLPLDGHPGGVGITRIAFAHFEELVADAHRLISECGCRDGCPSCVQSPKCGNLNEPLSKGGAVEILGRMLAGS